MHPQQPYPPSSHRPPNHSQPYPTQQYTGYPPSQQWPPTHVVRADRNGLGTAGLVIGIVAAVFAVIPLVGIIAWFIWPLGAVFAAIGLSRCKRGIATNRGVAIGGLVVSLVAAAICVAWVVVTAAAGAAHTPSSTSVASGQQPAALRTPAAQAPAKPVGPATQFGDGTYQVGVDVAAGRYKTPGPTDDLFKNCYWQRTRDDSGQFGSIIANDNTEGPGSVTIKAGEFFQTSGGCVWAKQ